MKLLKSSELTNEQYHGDTEHYSSSQLKLAVADIEAFHKQYVLGERERKGNPAFALGTYYHTAILEPELLDKECAVFTGKMRRGKEWEAFKVKNEGKAIITNSDYDKAQTLINSTKNNEIVNWLLSEGEAELSCFSSLCGVDIKVRADWIDKDRGFIMDLKSTTGNTKDEHQVQGKVSGLDYDLSAALYMDAFNAAMGSEVIKDFYWVFATKELEYSNCTVYRASKQSLAVGRAKYQKAIALIKKWKRKDWLFVDTMHELDAPQWEKDLWLQKKEVKQEVTTVDDSSYL